MNTDLDKLIAELMEDVSDRSMRHYWELLFSLENAIAAQLFRSCKDAKMNMMSFARPFFRLQAMTGRRGTRS